MIEKMTDFIGSVKIPDTFVAESSSLAYVSNTKGKIKIKPNVPLTELKKYFDARKLQYSKIVKSQNFATFGKSQKNLSKLYNLPSLPNNDTRFSPLRR